MSYTKSPKSTKGIASEPMAVAAKQQAEATSISEKVNTLKDEISTRVKLRADERYAETIVEPTVSLIDSLHQAIAKREEWIQNRNDQIAELQAIEYEVYQLIESEKLTEKKLDQIRDKARAISAT